MDFFIDSLGDIDREKVALSLNRIRYQHIISSVNTAKGEWPQNQRYGSDVEKYIGAITIGARSIESAISDSLIETGLLSKNDIFIELTGITSQGVSIFLKDSNEQSLFKKIDVSFYGYVEVEDES